MLLGFAVWDGKQNGWLFVISASLYLIIGFINLLISFFSLLFFIGQVFFFLFSCITYSIFRLFRTAGLWFLLRIRLSLSFSPRTVLFHLTVI